MRLGSDGSDAEMRRLRDDIERLRERAADSGQDAAAFFLACAEIAASRRMRLADDERADPMVIHGSRHKTLK